MHVCEYEDMKSEMDKKIDSMKIGDSIKLGGNSEVWTTCEKFVGGIRFVRHTHNSSVVFKVSK